MEVEDLEKKRHFSKEKEKTSKGRFLVLGSVGVGYREKGVGGIFCEVKACYLIIFIRSNTESRKFDLNHRLPARTWHL